MDAPRLRAITQAFPFFFEYFGLQLGFAGCGALRIEAQKERDAKGCFRGACNPAGEDIGFLGGFIGGFWKIDVVGADAQVLWRLAGLVRPDYSTI